MPCFSCAPCFFVSNLTINIAQTSPHLIRHLAGAAELQAQHQNFDPCLALHPNRVALEHARMLGPTL